MSVKIVFFMLVVVGSTTGFGEEGFVSSLIGRFGAAAKLQCVIDDYVREVVEEAKGVRVIYTDGAFDDDIRREAQRRGGELEPISMINGEQGTVSLQMALAEEKNVAVQLGFEMWKCRGREFPPCSGVLACTGGMSEDERLWGVAVAERLGKRILELHEKGVFSLVLDKKLRSRFLIVQWRISRLARIRAEREDRAGNTALARKESALADRLDHANPSLNKILPELEKAREHAKQTITPRVGLKMALDRADFTQARSYAESILKNDPDDSAANFAMGMHYYIQKQWPRAEEFLRKCLIKNPNEPAVWNNLALVCLYTGRYEEGLRCAQKAQEFLPESEEVKDTIKQIQAAREKAAARKP